jgi:predicted DNA-binding transcriptional regulator AlpA
MNGLNEITADKPRRQRGDHDRANRVRDVADIFGTSERHVWRLIASGQLKAERLGARCVRVFDSEIARYRESLRAAA